MEILVVIASVLDVVLLLVTMVAVLKLPGLLERIAAQQQQTQQATREVLAEIRTVTRAQQ